MVDDGTMMVQCWRAKYLVLKIIATPYYIYVLSPLGQWRHLKASQRDNTYVLCVCTVAK